jgi:gliding motility-associated lipoprotein GldH
MTGCNKSTIFEAQETIENNTWGYQDFVRFNVPINDSTIPYNYYMMIRNTTDYTYSNLYLFVRTRFPDGTLHADTINLMLADVSGKWLGKGIGKYRMQQFLISPNAFFPQQGEYIFEVEQAMREKELQGINSVGIKIEKSVK